MRILLCGFAALVFVSCNRPETELLFTSVDSSQTHVSFVNAIYETQEFNVMTYEYLYNGAGVGIGDLNNDQLPDVYFVGNDSENKLYLNKGNLVFEDITRQAGVGGKRAWKTGVTLCDVNGDGYLDIYVCYSGNGSPEDRANELYINDARPNAASPTFSEKAKQYGLDAPGSQSTHAAFFDYDLDGDLDMFLLNHATHFYNPFYNANRLRAARHPTFGNRLYRNDAGFFTEVSEQAGIYGSGINFGLSVSISDLNLDGYPDIYVTNDYDERDFFYLNNRDGTFAESLSGSFGHISKYSMGSDIADLNNDQLPDVITLDMLPEDNRRQKLLKGADEYDRYQMAVDNGYYYQQMRNMLHLHQGIDTRGQPMFSEIGQLAGIAATDWSWAALAADFDNDGLKDVFISNGYLRDFTNMDFLKYEVDVAMKTATDAGKDISTKESYASNLPLTELIKKMPSTKVHNYMFRNNGNLSFTDQSAAWGFAEPTITTGTAYADLDNDGDLDLVTNHTNQPAGIYRNNAEKLYKQNFIKIQLHGLEKNRFGVGAKVYVNTGDTQLFQEMMPTRGYQSSVDQALLFGIGAHTQVSEIKVIWPGGKKSVINAVAAGSRVNIYQKEAVTQEKSTASHKTYLTEAKNTGINFVHQENGHIDFKTEKLLPYQLSKAGPRLAKADANNDGLEDVYIGGAAGQAGTLFLQQTDNSFRPASSQAFQADAACEDTDAAFLDIEPDGDMDLYVASGGHEFAAAPALLQDRLYINDGQGNFVKAGNTMIPDENLNGSCVTVADYDRDGDTDIFVASRSMPGHYAVLPKHLLLRNDRESDGKRQRKFTPLLVDNIGMVTDALFTDIDRDGWPDLLLVGDWMPVTILRNQRGKWMPEQLPNSNGLWNCIAAHDFDKDGDTDFVLGNVGNNTIFKGSVSQPLTMYVDDFDSDGRTEHIICRYIQKKSYPMPSRDELLDQVNGLRKKFVTYSQYSDAVIQDIFSQKALQNAKQFSVVNTQTCYLENRGSHAFKLTPLPIEAQFSVVKSLLVTDFNSDGNADILVGGNFDAFRVQNGRCDANFGTMMTGNGKGQFSTIPQQEVGIFLKGEIRDMISITQKSGQTLLLLAKNSQPVQIVQVSHTEHE